MNIKQVAQAAGVSPTTVSRVFSGAAPVDAATARRVQQVAKRVGYIPNRYARALGSGRSNTFGLIISDIANPFFPDLVKAFEQKAREFRYDTLVVDTDYDTQRMEQCVRRMIEHKVDGVAIMTSETAPGVVQILSRRKIPMVFLDTGKVGPFVSNIAIDYEHGVCIALDHLMTSGHRKIAFIQGPAQQQSAIIRKQSFVAYFKQRGLTLDENYLLTGNHAVDGGQKAFRDLVALKDRPTAVLCSNDLTAVGVLSEAHLVGIKVPDELSIIGFDDIQLSSLVQPPLTTVRISRAEVASRAFTSLYGNTQNDRGMGLKHKIKPELVIRHSTAALT